MHDARLDHRQLLAALSREQRRALTEKSDRPGIVRLCVHFGSIAGLGLLIAARAPLWPVLVPIQGILIVFLFTLEHETIHGTAFRTGWLNQRVAQICGFLIAIPATWFRYFHFAHHRHTQDPRRDPELAAPKPESLGGYVVHVSGLPLWWSLAITLARNAAGRVDGDFVPGNARGRVVREARVTLALYGLLAGLSIAAGSDVFLFIWVIPAVVGQPFLRLYLLAEHGRCPFVANMLENTRTTYTNRLVRWIAWNMPYHAEHHAYPAVPFHKLPHFHALARAHLKVTENGYRRFHARYVGGLRGSGDGGRAADVRD